MFNDRELWVVVVFFVDFWMCLLEEDIILNVDVIMYLFVLLKSKYIYVCF